MYSINVYNINISDLFLITRVLQCWSVERSILDFFHFLFNAVPGVATETEVHWHFKIKQTLLSIVTCRFKKNTFIYLFNSQICMLKWAGHVMLLFSSHKWKRKEEEEFLKTNNSFKTKSCSVVGFWVSSWIVSIILLTMCCIKMMYFTNVLFAAMKHCYFCTGKKWYYNFYCAIHW